MGWFDEDESNLVYAFYRFPVSSSVPEVDENGNLLTPKSSGTTRRTAALGGAGWPPAAPVIGIAHS